MVTANQWNSEQMVMVVGSCHESLGQSGVKSISDKKGGQSNTDLRMRLKYINVTKGALPFEYWYLANVDKGLPGVILHYGFFVMYQ